MNGKTAQPVGRRGGFTLLEALMAATLLTVAIVAVTTPFLAATTNQQADGRATLASALAQEMMDEILAKAFNDANATSAGYRSSKVNMLAYNGYTEAAGNIRNNDGEVCADPLAANLSRGVSAGYYTVQNQDPNEQTMVQVTVTVKHRNTAIATLTRLAYMVHGGPNP